MLTLLFLWFALPLVFIFLLDGVTVDPSVSSKRFWSSFTLCLEGLILERMKNIGKKSGWKTVFFTVWQRVKNAENGKPGRKFSLPGPQISSSQIGRKTMERKVLSQPNYRNGLSFPTVTATQKRRRRRRQFSNPRLSTIHHHYCNPKITQNQHKTKSTQNQPIIIIIIIFIIFSLPCSFRTVKKKKKKKREMQRLEGWSLCVRESSSRSAAREEKNNRKVLLELQTKC